MPTVSHFAKAHTEFNSPLPQRVDSSTVPSFLLFKEVGGDKGLRNAVRYYWNCRNVTFRINGLVMGEIPSAIQPHEVIPPKRKTGQQININEQFAGGIAPAGWILNPMSLGMGDVIYLTDKDQYAVKFTVDASFLPAIQGYLTTNGSVVGLWGHTMQQEYDAWPALFGFGVVPAAVTSFNYTYSFYTFDAELPDEFEIPEGLYFYYSTGRVYNSNPPDPLPTPRPAITDLKMAAEYYDYPSLSTVVYSASGATPSGMGTELESAGIAKGVLILGTKATGFTPAATASISASDYASLGNPDTNTLYAVAE